MPATRTAPTPAIQIFFMFSPPDWIETPLIISGVFLGAEKNGVGSAIFQ
jgi:hypothetical protein